MASSNSELPPIIDVREMLDRIERDAGNDDEVPAYLDEIRDLLAAYGDRDRGARASLVDDIDGSVLAMREYLDDGSDADRWAEGIQNRFRIYRESLREASESLHLSGAALHRDGDDVDGAAAAHQGEEVTLAGTLVNQGDARDGVLRLVFYDDDHTATWKVESREFDVDAGERRAFEEQVYVPEDAAYYDVTALDATDPDTATL